MQDQPLKKRRRKIWSCSQCRKQKLSCDREQPICGRCHKLGRPDKCVYVEEVARKIAQNAPGNSELDWLARVPNGDVAHQDPSKAGTGLASRLEAIEKRLHASERTSYAKDVKPNGLATSSQNGVIPEFGVDDRDPIQALFVNRHNTIFRGTSFRTRFYGRTHSGCMVESIPGLLAFARDAFKAFPVLDHMRRDAFSLNTLAQHDHLAVSQSANLDLRALIPGKDEADRLVQVYLDTFDHIYHVIHRPTLEADYATLWQEGQEACMHIVVTVLLIVAIAKLLRLSGEDQSQPAHDPARNDTAVILDACDRWVQARNSRFATMNDFQISFLLIWGQQLSGKKCKRTWANIGRFVRICMCAGLHRDPGRLTESESPVDMEMRRRIWAAAAEFELQAAFEHGMSPIPWSGQSDISSPNNKNDDEHSQTRETYTKSSYLAISGESLLLRHRLGTLLNDIRHEHDFDEVQQITEELQLHIQAVPQASVRLKSLLSIQLYQYVLVLHEQQLKHHHTSSIALLASRHILIDTSRKIVDCHQAVVRNGDYIVELMMHDHVRAALSACRVYLMDSMAESVLDSAIEVHAMTIVEEALKMVSEKVVHQEGDERHLWLIGVARGLMKTRKTAERRHVFLKESVDLLLKAKQRAEDGPSNSRIESSENEGMLLSNSDTNALSYNQEGLPEMDTSFPWTGDFEDWIFEDWSLDVATIS